jgi:hypothetical protein
MWETTNNKPLEPIIMIDQKQGIIIKSKLLFFSSNKCEALLCLSLAFSYAKMLSQNHFDEPN